MLTAPHLGLAGLGLALALTGCGRKSEPSSSSTSTTEVEPRPDPLVVATDRGRVRGTTEGDVEVFRGIPYAAPPIAELRFRAPAPHPGWDGVRDATMFGSRCPQVGLVGGAVIGDEDCLTLNLWRPSKARVEPRPVLLFIHGGANAIGSGADLFQNGRRLARDRDVIVVTINYRLGLLGFLAHPGLTRESGTSGNWAYLDQIAALDWVARNIAAFGGDPERVTIFGESAGALAVCVLLASPLARGKFSAAIMQSGGCDVAPLAEREREGEQLMGRSSCADAGDPIACLRDLPIKRMVELAPVVTGDISNWALPIAGAVDGVVLPASPWAIFAAGEHGVVPTLVGNNAHETELFTPTTITTCAAYELAVRATFAESAAAILAEYPCEADANARLRYVELTTDALFNCQTRRILRSLAPAAARDSVSIHRYWYSYVRADPAVQKLRAFHGGELQMLFGTMTRFGYAVPERERELAEIMQTSWASLAATGSPVTAATPGWTAYEVARDNAVIFDAPVAAADAVGTAHCDFWDRLRADR